MRWCNFVKQFRYCKQGKNRGDRIIDRRHIDGTIAYRFWGSEIACYDPQRNVLKLDLCGWPTPTTIKRINAILNSFDLRWYVYRHLGDVFFCTENYKRAWIFERCRIDLTARRFKVEPGARARIVYEVGRKKVNEFNDYYTVRANGKRFVIFKNEMNALWEWDVDRKVAIEAAGGVPDDVKIQLIAAGLGGM